MFQLISQDPKSGARAGVLNTGHGPVETPVFMPVGTQGTVKTLTSEELHQIGAGMILGNTYHLVLRPGEGTIKKAGGLHQFIGWTGPILTDSGGYQVFSLKVLRKIDPDGVTFASHIDGSRRRFTPESVIQAQRDLGSDVAVVLDECLPYPSDAERVRKSVDLTLQWANRSLKAFREKGDGGEHLQLLFSVVQGGAHPELRRECARGLVSLDFDGYTIGGLSVGEPKGVMKTMVEIVNENLPPEKPRYLMGVGTPEDILEAIALGVDMFDCVLPTRLGRNGTVFTPWGKLNLKNARFKEDFRPIDEKCPCYACRQYSRAYLKHLHQAGEILGYRLTTLHNLTYYIHLMKEAREAIIKGHFSYWKKGVIEAPTENKMEE
ncbi:tRNA guanosine(34) transglycosylase Tgt [candidate division KSB1 bacterium]|nr:tRNA guanosine(34) transglycosylase Tgt [candidate division KSB1 bacterium]